MCPCHGLLLTLSLMLLCRRLNINCTQTHTKKKYSRYSTLLKKEDKAYNQRLYFAGQCTEMCLKTKGCTYWQTNKNKGCQMFETIRNTELKDAKNINMGTCSNT